MGIIALSLDLSLSLSLFVCCQVINQRKNFQNRQSMATTGKKKFTKNGVMTEGKRNEAVVVVHRQQTSVFLLLCYVFSFSLLTYLLMLHARPRDCFWMTIIIVSMILPVEQMLKFASIGFRFSHVLKNIDERIVQLQEFKKVHGHTQVPFDYTGHSGLGLWCRKTRDLYHLNKLAATRIEKLNAIDFDWSRGGNGGGGGQRHHHHG